MSALPAYDADQLAELLGLLPDVDSVELKLTVPDGDLRPLMRTLLIDSLDAQIRQVVFVDTPDLRLSAAGLVVRARRTQAKPGDVTVKLRPMLPADVPPGLRGLDGFKVELDASPAGFSTSCSLTAEVADRKVRRLIAGERTLAEVLSDRQLSLLTERLPDGVGLDDLCVLGPVHVLKSKFSPERLARRMVAELWFLPGGARMLELSTKAPPAEAFRTAAETKAFLAGHGVDLDAPQQMKTHAVLAALSAEQVHDSQE